MTSLLGRLGRIGRAATLLALLTLCSACTAQNQEQQSQPRDELAANAGRPTVSTPATLTPSGYLQLETGILAAEHSGEFANRTALEEVVKLTVAKRLEFLAQSEPAVFSDLGDHHSRDAGDLAFGLQAVLLPGAERRPTLSFSYFHTVYDGTAPDLDIGSSPNSALLLISADVRKFHIDTNYFVNEQVKNAVHRAQFGQTLSISHPITGKLSWTGELWHFTQPFLDRHAAGFLTGPAYAVSPRLVFDIGFNRGLTSSSTRWEFFTGFTYLLPRKLW